MTLLFDESNHQYYFDLEGGRRSIPSVTQILSPAWKPDPYYGEKGRKIHRAIQLFIKGTLDENTVSPIIAPYLAAFKDFMKQSGAKVIEYETMVYNDNPEYAGRYDAILQIDGSYLTDWKSGTVAAWHRMQVALYGTAVWLKDYLKNRLALLYLKETGKFDWKPLTLDQQIKAQVKGIEAVYKYYEKISNIFE